MRNTVRYAFLAVLVLASCGRSQQSTPAGVESSTGAQGNPLEITAGDNLRSLLKISEPEWKMFDPAQTVAARIDVDETRVTRVGSSVMGRITSLAAQEGQAVSQGQLLALISSTGLSDAQLGFLKALSTKMVSERALERAKILLNADVIGSAEFQRREAELMQAVAELDVARDQLELMGMPPESISNLEKTRQVNSVSRIVASIDGTVLERNVTLGQVVQPADTAFEIADLSSVWLQADVPEQNASNLKVGTPVEAEVAALPGVKIQGKLSFVSAMVNPETRTVRVRMNLLNPDRAFKPAMLATVIIHDQTQRRQLIPSASVIRESDNEYIFVQTEEDKFVLRPVSLGEEFEGFRVLREGIRPGERIVIDGAFHLNNERRRQLLRVAESS